MMQKEGFMLKGWKFGNWILFVVILVIVFFIGKWLWYHPKTVEKNLSSISSKLREREEEKVLDSSSTIKGVELETGEFVPMKIEKTASGYKGSMEIANTNSPVKARAYFVYEANQPPQAKKKPRHKPVVKEKKICPAPITAFKVETPPPAVQTPLVKEQPKVVVREEPIKSVIVRNETEDYDVVIMETFPDGGFKRYQLLKNSGGAYRNVTPGGEHGIGVYPGSRELTLKVKVINKRGRVKYETRVTHFRFDASIDGQSRKEKYFWIIADRECKSSIYKDGEMQRNKRKRSSIIEE